MLLPLQYQKERAMYPKATQRKVPPSPQYSTHLNNSNKARSNQQEPCLSLILACRGELLAHGFNCRGYRWRGDNVHEFKVPTYKQVIKKKHQPHLYSLAYFIFLFLFFFTFCLVRPNTYKPWFRTFGPIISNQTPNNLSFQDFSHYTCLVCVSFKIVWISSSESLKFIL